MNSRFLLIFGVFIAIFVGLLVVNRQEAGPEIVGETTNHTYGEGSSGVVVTEYGDFQCPACRNYFPIFAQLKEEYKGQVTFRFRHFPIVNIHPLAMVAHRAAEAAAQQDKFWEMHDLLYQNQQNWTNSNNAASVFEGYARELGLDIEQYQQDVVAQSTAADIQADLDAGNDLGVTGTPGFVINGELIETPRSYEAFQSLIDEAIKESSTS